MIICSALAIYLNIHQKNNNFVLQFLKDFKLKTLNGYVLPLSSLHSDHVCCCTTRCGFSCWLSLWRRNHGCLKQPDQLHSSAPPDSLVLTLLNIPYQLFPPIYIHIHTHTDKNVVLGMFSKCFLLKTILFLFLWVPLIHPGCSRC